jgi:DNA polymerase III subunit delta'
MTRPALWPVCGHERVIARLASEVTTERLRHAYLILGTPGVGKASLAQTFASAILCPTGWKTGSGCGVCDACRRIDRGIHPDLEEFSLERQRETGSDRSATFQLSIETVREIIVSASYRPYSARHRVIIVHDADTLTVEGQEALLKTLEEPPDYLVLLLIASNQDVFRPTLMSRCDIVTLFPVPMATIEACLVERGIKPGRASLLAAQADGAPGWAMRAADDPEILEQRGEQLERIAKWALSSPFRRVVRAFELAETFPKDREEVFGELEATLAFWRRVMMMTIGMPDDLARHVLEDTTRKSLQEAFDVETTILALESVTTCLADLESNVRPRLALETMVMQWPNVISRVTVP